MDCRNYSRDLQPAKWGRTVILRSNNPHDRMSALPPKADIDQHGRDVRFVPKADIGRSFINSSPITPRARVLRGGPSSTILPWSNISTRSAMSAATRQPQRTGKHRLLSYVPLFPSLVANSHGLLRMGNIEGLLDVWQTGGGYWRDVAKTTLFSATFLWISSTTSAIVPVTTAYLIDGAGDKLSEARRTSGEEQCSI